jgi:hypothetical protein
VNLVIRSLLVGIAEGMMTGIQEQNERFEDMRDIVVLHPRFTFGDYIMNDMRVNSESASPYYHYLAAIAGAK